MTFSLGLVPIKKLFLKTLFQSELNFLTIVKTAEVYKMLTLEKPRECQMQNNSL